MLGEDFGQGSTRVLGSAEAGPGGVGEQSHELVARWANPVKAVPRNVCHSGGFHLPATDDDRKNEN